MDYEEIVKNTRLFVPNLVVIGFEEIPLLEAVERNCTVRTKIKRASGEDDRDENFGKPPIEANGSVDAVHCEHEGRRLDEILAIIRFK